MLEAFRGRVLGRSRLQHNSMFWKRIAPLLVSLRKLRACGVVTGSDMRVLTFGYISNYVNATPRKWSHMYLTGGGLPSAATAGTSSLGLDV
jgi:hypothetical protein